MNYRSTFHGFRNSLLRQWINWQLSLSQSLSQEKKRGAEQSTSSQRTYFTFTAALRPTLILPLRPWWLTGLCSWTFFSSYWQRGTKSIHLLAFRKRKVPTLPSTLCTQECIQRNVPEISTSEPTSPRETAAFCNPLFTHIQVPVPVEG